MAYLGLIPKKKCFFSSALTAAAAMIAGIFSFYHKDKIENKNVLIQAITKPENMSEVKIYNLFSENLENPEIVCFVLAGIRLAEVLPLEELYKLPSSIKLDEGSIETDWRVAIVYKTNIDIKRVNRSDIRLDNRNSFCTKKFESSIIIKACQSCRENKSVLVDVIE